MSEVNTEDEYVYECRCSLWGKHPLMDQRLASGNRDAVCPECLTSIEPIKESTDG